MFYGIHEFHLNREETLMMPFGEMIDLISCLAIFNGAAIEVKTYSFDEAMALE